MLNLNFAAESDWHSPSEYTHNAIVQIDDDPVVWAIVSQWDDGSIERILRKFSTYEEARKFFNEFY